MRSINVERAQEGMVLAAPVIDRRGRLLIPVGATLSERHVKALLVWGVPKIEVEGAEPEGEAPAAPSPEALAKAEAAVEQRFAVVGTGHPFLEQLKACAIERALTPVGLEAVRS